MRFGLIGTGLMGQEHLRNLLLMPDAEIVALADPAASSLDWSRQTLGPKAAGVACFTEPARMLREADLDAVVVASPNHTHRAVLEPLWQTGLHILCEKPMATTIEDARAGSHRGIFWVGMEYRWMPPVTAFIDDVARGRAGRLHRLAMQEHRSPFLAKVGDWNRFNRNTGGTVVEKCCHFFDLMRLIVASEPVRVFCWPAPMSIIAPSFMTGASPTLPTTPLPSSISTTASAPCSISACSPRAPRSRRNWSRPASWRA